MTQLNWQDGSQHPIPGVTLSRNKLRWLVKNMKIASVDEVPDNAYKRLSLVDGTIRYAKSTWCEELVLQTYPNITPEEPEEPAKSEEPDEPDISTLPRPSADSDAPFVLYLDNRTPPPRRPIWYRPESPKPESSSSGSVCSESSYLNFE